MGDKSPKSKEKNLKQKDTGKVKEVQKAKSEKDAKAFETGKPKK